MKRDGFGQKNELESNLLQQGHPQKFIDEEEKELTLEINHIIRKLSGVGF